MDEVLICARDWNMFRWRRIWPFIGYVNLASPNPVLELRTSIPFLLFLFLLASSVILLPIIIAVWYFGFSTEVHTIEKFLLSKPGPLSPITMNAAL